MDVFCQKENMLCVSNEILEEYAEILQRLTDSATADYVIKTILNSPFVELVTPYFHFGLITVDPDDNKFIDCAIAANARYIVTNDRHYDAINLSWQYHIQNHDLDECRFKTFA